MAALKLVRELKPALIILSPPRRTFSSLRHLSDHKRSRDVVEREKSEGLEHLRFTAQLAKLQMKEHRGFLFEHPMFANSCESEPLAELIASEGVFQVKLDICVFGLVTRDNMPALKPTMLLTNIETLAIHLGRRCEGRHLQHQPPIGGRAAAAAIYTDQFVDSILRALRQHLQLRPEGHPPQDYWSFNGVQLVRHHVHPRMALFNPSHVTNIPVEISVLGDQRQTANNVNQKLSDNWRNGGVVSPWPQHWNWHYNLFHCRPHGAAE